jgi:copper chaperone CopZ
LRDWSEVDDEIERITMITRYQATGLTCGHCAQAVTDELTALDGVESVAIELVAHGASSITVTSAVALTDDAVAAALDEAGDYVLVGR